MIFYIPFIGFLLFSVTIRFEAFKSSTEEGIRTFIPVYGWYFGLSNFEHKLKKTVIITLAVTYLFGVMGLVFDVFLPSMKKSKTKPALANIQMICNGAQNYFYGEQYDEHNNQIPFEEKKFPETPEDGISTHYRIPEGDPHSPDCDFENQPWASLGFELNQESYFRYTYRSGGVGQNAWFEVVVEGDLDGDGKTSTFYQEGTISAMREVAITPLHVENELE